MSIFPKRSIPGSTVTIHWNFNTAHIKDTHVFPYVRIGVQLPDGTVTMLFEQHVPALPAIQSPPEAGPKQMLYLNKNTPLLVLADYLSTHHKREVLVDILQHIQSGRHYYFVYNVPADAMPGKYTLISEVYNGGKIKYSTTAPDDFFLIEKITVDEGMITNHSWEKTPVKIITYKPNEKINPENVRVFEMEPEEIIEASSFPDHSFLIYNEERIILPLHNKNDIRCIRNQQAPCLLKDDKLHVLLTDNEVYELENEAKTIWEKADGIATRTQLCHKDNEHIYQEMVDNKLIIELNEEL